MIVLAVSSNDVAPGTLGFLVVAGMGLVLFFLFRSMTKHLRKVNDQARLEDEARSAAADDATTRGDAAPTRDVATTGDGALADADQRPGRGQRQPR